MVDFIKRHQKDIWVLACIILACIAAFAVGRLSAQSREPVRMYYPQGAAVGKIVAVKTGSRYYYPWCSGARVAREENKVWYASIALARAAGFTPAANCSGLQ